LQVIFRRRATNYRGFLRKMTCKDKASYGSWPPCTLSPIPNTLILNPESTLSPIYTITGSRADEIGAGCLCGGEQSRDQLSRLDSGAPHGNILYLCMYIYTCLHL